MRSKKNSLAPVIFTVMSQSRAHGALMKNFVILHTRTRFKPSPLAHTLSGSTTLNENGLPVDIVTQATCSWTVTEPNANSDAGNETQTILVNLFTYYLAYCVH